MSNTDFLLHSTSITDMSRRTTDTSILPKVPYSFMTCFSSQIWFKISKNQQDSSCVVAQIIAKNGAAFQIKPNFKKIFMTELSCICNKKLQEISQTPKKVQNFSQIPTEQSNQMVQQSESFFQIRLADENNQIRMEFIQKKLMMEQIMLSDEDLIKKFILLLQEINAPLTFLLQRMGTLKPSYCQKLKNLIKIEKQKNIFGKILRHKVQNSYQTMTEQNKSQQGLSSSGVFEHLNLIKEEEISESEMVFKRGGYFNIVKRKFVVSKSNYQISNLQCKIFAEKKLSRRKRLNTIYNYEGKIPKELKLLECLNNISIPRLTHFAKYYILNESSLMKSQPQSMVDQSDIMSKDTLSTTSQERPLNSLTDVIYMDYYEENLEEYLSRKGQLDILETLSLVRQIFQSVQILHKVGIVHRDLKPANFMIEKMHDGSIKTKLIDFGESTHVSSKYESSQILGFSTQYAALECTYSCKEGFNSRQIDLWSLGVIIYKLTTNRLPVTFSKCFKSDIKYEWPTSLNFFITQYGRGKWSLIESMLVSLSLLFMRVKPEERLDIRKGLMILGRIQKLAKQFSQQ